MTLAIIDYGMGNLHSVEKALEKVSDQRVIVTSDPQRLLEADRVVFPGVGAMRDCMQALDNLGLIDVIPVLTATRPFLGICLGMQVLLECSQENGGVETLGLIAGRVAGFSSLSDEVKMGIKIPHMGWNQVQGQMDHPIWHKIPNNTFFYFANSYYAILNNSTQVLAECTHGLTFAAALSHHLCVAVQFHPEKSQSMGLKLLQNFVQWNGRV